MQSVAPWEQGHYVGECDLTAGPGRAERCYTPEAWVRLESVAATYDPEGRFFGFLD